MKINILLFALFSSFFLVAPVFSQLHPDIQYNRYNDKRGLNIFETTKEDTVGYTGFKVRLGADFALQFQGLSHTNSRDSLVGLGNDFNLPTANLNLDVQLHDGIRMHLRTYLSSKHHPEAWVKGGHIQIDKLTFIKSGFLEKVMNITTIKLGLDEFSYGDAVFRRSDNARTLYNPFVGNYLMDAFSTEPFGEITIQARGFIGVLGITNGKLNQNVVVNDDTDNQPSFYGKLGYDSQVAENLRLRLTGSIYHNSGTSTGHWLYGGDRAGSRYYKVMEDVSMGSTDFDGRINPRFRQMTAIQVNPFVKFYGLEFFGIYEVVVNGEDEGSGMFTQMGAELLYRFGGSENFYIGGRYNSVIGEAIDGAPQQNAQRINAGAGWFLTKNILAKVEYVNQMYSGDGWAGTRFAGGEFSGIIAEAVISF